MSFGGETRRHQLGIAEARPCRLQLHNQYLVISPGSVVSVIQHDAQF